MLVRAADPSAGRRRLDSRSTVARERGRKSQSSNLSSPLIDASSSVSSHGSLSGALLNSSKLHSFASYLGLTTSDDHEKNIDTTEKGGANVARRQLGGEFIRGRLDLQDPALNRSSGSMHTQRLRVLAKVKSLTDY